MHAQKAELFRSLHQGKMLVLPNAWDVASARVFEKAGFPAVATSSAGIAASFGYPDGQNIPMEEMLRAVARIAGQLDVPLSADLEGGYAANADEMRQITRMLLDCGAAGLNLEDGLGVGALPIIHTSQHVEKIRVVREVSQAAGIPLVINARTDIYWKNIGDPANRFAHAVHRGNMYLAAGADCVFVPGVSDAGTIADLAREIRGPLNILAAPGTPRLAELASLGVARVTFGSGPMRATLGLLERLASEILSNGTFDSMNTGAMPYVKSNALFR